MSPKGRGANSSRGRRQKDSLERYEAQARGMAKLQTLGQRHAHIHHLEESSGAGQPTGTSLTAPPVPTGRPAPDTPPDVRAPAWLTHLVGGMSAVAIGAAAGSLFTSTADGWSAFALIVGLVGTVWWANQRRQL